MLNVKCVLTQRTVAPKTYPSFVLCDQRVTSSGEKGEHPSYFFNGGCWCVRPLRDNQLNAHMYY